MKNKSNRPSNIKVDNIRCNTFFYIWEIIDYELLMLTACQPIWIIFCQEDMESRLYSYFCEVVFFLGWFDITIKHNQFYLHIIKEFKVW